MLVAVSQTGKTSETVDDTVPTHRQTLTYISVCATDMPVTHTTPDGWPSGRVMVTRRRGTDLVDCSLSHIVIQSVSSRCSDLWSLRWVLQQHPAVLAWMCALTCHTACPVRWAPFPGQIAVGTPSSWPQSTRDNCCTYKQLTSSPYLSEQWASDCFITDSTQDFIK